MKALEYLVVLIAFLALCPIAAFADDWQRPARLAGSWYEGDADKLRDSIQAYLAAGQGQPVPGQIYAIVTPHAGHMYSGATAGQAWAAARNLRPQPETVILLGPSHHYPLAAPSIWPRGSLQTPLGPVEVDEALADRLAQLCGAQFKREAHLPEHCLEVQLPFIKTALPQARVVTLLTGRPDLDAAKALGSALARVARDQPILLAVSSDLSHFHSLNEAKRLDGRLAEYVEKLDPQGLLKAYGSKEVEACGIQGLAAVMFAARELGAGRGVVLAQTTSASVNHDQSRVVGYLAAALADENGQESSSPNGLSPGHKKQLLDLARKALTACVTGERLDEPGDLDGVLTRERAVFITLRKNGDLRGCIGHMTARQPLYEAVISMTRAAALEDPRFMPVKPRELDQISISISVLTPMTPVRPNEVRVGRDGLLISYEGRQGVLLPQVPVELGWDRERYLAGLCQKARLPVDAWRHDGVKLWRFEAEVLK